MKYSKYNLIIDDKKDFLLFNTLNGNTFLINNETKNLINNNKIEDLDEDTLNKFIKSKIIIQDNFNESQFLNYKLNKSKYGNSCLTATLLLTWKCNFKCIYCYEGAGNVYNNTMNIDIADKVVKFLINTTINNNLNEIHIVLFGGEPLLNIDIGFYILEKLKNFCDSNNKSLSCSIVTNGFLLNEEIIKKLIGYNCIFTQITIDGIKEIHDSRRMLKNGNPTFDKIVKNIKLLETYNNKIHCIIRINIDKENIQKIEELLKYLKKQNLNKIRIDFGVVHSTTEVCSNYNIKCFEDNELGPVLDNLWNLAEQYKYMKYPRIRRKDVFCGLYNENNFAISPKGELYKCWEMVGIEKHKIGDIDNNGSVNNINNCFYDWMSINPLQNQICSNCKYLPLCGGGCIMYSYNESKSYHGEGCFQTKGVIEKQLLHWISNK